MAADIDLNGLGEPPHSLDAEQAVIGAAIMDADALAVVLNNLKSECFYVSLHRDIFSIITRLFILGSSVDVISVIDEALKMHIFESEAAAREYFYQLAERVPSSKNIESYCNIVAEKFYMRSLISASKEIIDMCSGSEESAEMLLNYAEQKIYDIRQGKDAQDLRRIEDVVIEAYDDIAKKSGEDREKYLGINCGFSGLNNIITGLNKSDLLIVAARPAMGKTSFVLNIAANVCRYRTDTEVVIFSLEMSNEQLVTRMLSSESFVENDKLLKGNLSSEDWVNLADGAERLSNMQIYLDDTAGITVTQMKAKLRRRHNLGLVIIDYLQLMSSGRRIDNRVTEISEITRQLKLMAKEMNVPVIVLSQLSRSVESRTDKRPILSDLRESGSIEQDADIVMFLYRDFYYNKEKCPDPTLAECIIAKNRHGETGTVNLRWNGQFTRFSSEASYDAGGLNVGN